ncbi:MAG TPA: GNAT family N-acetyltransferase [Candidatus Eremiobacteraceae bacterium]|nr:GNAT family N-acetyltransferase [Candidatus Eremiobacteraceae bacterium]
MNEIELRGAGFRAFPLTPDHLPALQRLLEASRDYFELVLGRPPGPAEAQSVLRAGPEECRDASNKMIYGLTRADGGDEIIGVLDVFRNYPESGAWYIGLLLLSPDTRGSGLGREVVDAFVYAAKAEGAREIQLNVVDQNKGGLRFWTECGFTEVRRWQQHFGQRESTFIRMRRRFHTSQRVERLSAAVVDILSHEEYHVTVARLKEEVATTTEPFVWSVIDMSGGIAALVPDDIKSAWIFVLKKDTSSGSHFHPNSIQHMAMIEGRGNAVIGGALSRMTRFAAAANPEDAWVIIDERVSHEFFPEETDMVVISFHTCSPEELLEIDAISGRPRVYETSAKS